MVLVKCSISIQFLDQLPLANDASRNEVVACSPGGLVEVSANVVGQDLDQGSLQVLHNYGQKYGVTSNSIPMTPFSVFQCALLIWS